MRFLQISLVFDRGVDILQTWLHNNAEEGPGEAPRNEEVDGEEVLPLLCPRLFQNLSANKPDQLQKKMEGMRIQITKTMRLL